MRLLANLWVRRGRQYERAEEWARAAQAYEWALDHHPGSADLHALLGCAHEALEDWSRAATSYRAAIERDDRCAAWHYRLGRCRHRLDDWEGAERSYLAAIELEGRATPAHWFAWLGQTRARLERWADAADAYAEAVAHDGFVPAWFEQLGEARARIPDWDAAAEAFQAAVDLDPSSAERHHRLGFAREKQQQWLGAVTAYQAAVAREGSRPEWYLRLGIALDKTRHHTAAAYTLRRADRSAIERNGADVEPPTRALPYRKRIELSLLRKAQYAYGIHRACRQARSLKVSRITAIEFGVAGGNGLVAMEDHAAEISELTGVEVDVVGFDTGEGLYEVSDQRDMPYAFAGGNYRMDRPRLEARLRDAELVIGDAAETFGTYLERGEAPIGMMAFDMDLYSATSAVLRHVSGDPGRFLPRPSVYFDDVVGRQQQDYSDFAGELLAIHEFNAANDRCKLSEDRFFRALPINKAWHHGVYTLHLFDHALYPIYVSSADADTLSLREDRR